MRKLAIFILLAFFLLPSCSNKSSGSVKVVKPKTSKRWYDPKKDKKKKRTKVVNMKN